MRVLKGTAAVGLVVGGHLVASAQSVNIDLDIQSGPGSGAPSSTFGAAASSPGYWNRIEGNLTNTPLSLIGLDGANTTALLVQTGGLGGARGYNNPLTSGDYALPMNDVAEIGENVVYHFSGFHPGRYAVYTYAVEPSGVQVTATVTIPGAENPVATVSGPIQANQFILGVSHSLQYVDLTSDSFQIQVSGPWPNTSCNGFQLVAVPEPTQVLVVAPGISLIGLRRRSQGKPR